MPRVHKENEEWIEMSQKKNAPKEKRIPIAKMQEGIDCSLKKSMEHLASAEVLICKKLLNGSVALIEFAIEEFGRAVILREMLRNNTETIERRYWYNHDYKYNAAFRELPKELKTIWAKVIPVGTATVGRAMMATATVGAVGATIGRSRYSVNRREEMISPEARCDAIFIDFNEVTQIWANGIKANGRKLESIMGKLRISIRDFKV
jgi:AbiV family abortive infection protein